MSRAIANGVEIEYTWRGADTGPVILMTRGLGGQLIDWPDAFCDGLADAGFRILLYDNRDIGLSQKFGPCAPAGVPVEPLYDLHDMAADSVGLLDALDIERAHILGTSMGGMISQIVAARHPARAASLVSIISSSGERDPTAGPKEAIDALWAPWPPAGERDAILEKGVRDGLLFSSRTYPPDEDDLRAGTLAWVERSYCPGAIERHAAAVRGTPERSGMLRTISCPTLVMHGDEDTLIPQGSGERAAELIPGAVFKLVRGMGHDLPAPLLPDIVAAIAAHCRAAERA